MHITFFILFVFLCTSSIFSQGNKEYIVTAGKLNVRSGPSTQNTKLFSLVKNDVVVLLNDENSGWWQIQHKNRKGYVSSRYLSKKDVSKYDSWNKMKYSSGDSPDCVNITPKYDYSLDNFLKVVVGSNTDVVIKLMNVKKRAEDKCIRAVYVRSGETYKIKNIPEGKYYLKIAYGKDYRQQIVEDKCYMKFIKNALYEKGTRILDFNKVQKPNTKIGNNIYENWDVPSFELSLDIKYSDLDMNSFNSNEISEADFNN